MQAQQTPPLHHAGEEPIVGYRLLSPLGQGGFGEVWKCEVTGGLYKAIKFVRPDTEGSTTASQERTALERIKFLRHPFILSIERVEEIDGELVIVMELADESLYALQGKYREDKAVGVPRDELLSYMIEAAEALDWLNFEHGLQHLDVKPHNLFLVSGHVKVADFGLVHHLGDEEGDQSPMRRGGVTPLYSAPEMLRGTLSRHSDQYSLAVVYQQLLTGTVPFWHENVYELMMQHLCGEPDLLAVPENDRPMIARALAKAPEQRYGSCMEFVQALISGPGPSLQQSGKWRRVLIGKHATPTTTPAISPSARASAGQNSPAENHFDKHAHPARKETDTPTRRIRALTAAQLAAAPDLATPPVPFSPRPSPPPAPQVALPQALPEAAATETAAAETAVAVAPAAKPGFSADSDASQTRHVEEGSHLPAPTAVSLPGYRFISCVNQSPLSDQWRAEDSAGTPLRAQCLLGFVRYDARLISHLKALRDRVLPPTQVHWSPAERLVLLSDAYQGSLRDRFESRQSQGGAGIPRLELLSMLRTAAEALDALWARYGLQHLGLHPRNLLVDGMRLWIADFGLIPLVWLPTGQSAAALNSRYAAPELFDRRPSRSADQYSLALIFAEMLTGIHPRPNRHGSGSHLRPGRNGSASASAGSRAAASQRGPRIDLDLLPAPDREIIARALAEDPEKRFESCTALIDALELSGSEPNTEDLFASLPPVIPYASLMGELAGPDVILPALPQLVTELVNAEQAIEGPSNCRYFVLPDQTWEYRCPLQVFPGAMRLKVEGFRAHWQAQIVAQQGESYTLHIDLGSPRSSFWDFRQRKQHKIEVEVHVDPLDGSHSRMTEALVRLRFLNGTPEQGMQVLNKMAPQIFESIRVYLQATQEQRTRERWPLKQPLRVHSILPDLETAPSIEGTVRNISFGGIGFRVPEEPPTEYLYLHLYQSSQALGYAILARVLRRKRVEDGFEIGCAFIEAKVSESILD